MKREKAEVVVSAAETDILSLIPRFVFDESGRDKQFRKISRENGLKAALDFRDEALKGFDEWV